MKLKKFFKELYINFLESKNRFIFYNKNKKFSVAIFLCNTYKSNYKFFTQLTF